MVSPLAATNVDLPQGAEYIFMVISPAEGYLEGPGRHRGQAGAQDRGVVNEDTLFSKGRRRRRPSSWPRSAGCRSSTRRAYPKGNTDFSALLTKVKVGEPRRDRGGDLLRRRRWRSRAR